MKPRGNVNFGKSTQNQGAYKGFVTQGLVMRFEVAFRVKIPH